MQSGRAPVKEEARPLVSVYASISINVRGLRNLQTSQSG